MSTTAPISQSPCTNQRLQHVVQWRKLRSVSTVRACTQLQHLFNLRVLALFTRPIRTARPSHFVINENELSSGVILTACTLPLIRREYPRIIQGTESYCRGKLNASFHAPNDSFLNRLQTCWILGQSKTCECHHGRDLDVCGLDETIYPATHVNTQQDLRDDARFVRERNVRNFGRSAGPVRQEDAWQFILNHACTPPREEKKDRV